MKDQLINMSFFFLLVSVSLFPNNSNGLVNDERIEMADPKSIPTIVLNKVKWQEEMIANVHSEYQVHVEELLEQGFTLWKDALAENDVNELIHGPAVPGTVFGVNYNASSTSLPSTSTAAADPAPRQRVLRKRSSSQVWSGAKRTINGLVSKSGDSVTVCHGCSVCVSSLLSFESDTISLFFCTGTCTVVHSFQWPIRLPIVT